MAKADAAYNVNDLIPAVRNGLSANGKLYASPFYAESSFLMYRKDVLAKAGVDHADAPDVGSGRRDRAQGQHAQMAGICLRGKPGWGDLGASFTTVLNTFGGTWWSSTADGKPGAAQVDQPAFKEALEFYVEPRAGRGREGRRQLELQRVPHPVPGRQGRDVVRRHGRGRPARGRTTARSRARTATRSPRSRRPRRPVGCGAGRSRSRRAHRTRTDAWKYIAWATGPQYIKAAGTHDQGRLGGDPAGHPPLDLRDPAVPEGGGGVRADDARRHAGRADQQPRHDASGPGCPACSTSASRSSRTSAIAARSSSRA